MLRSLFGCKSVERILLFLLVNEKCYAHQLHRTLGISLTPAQRALARLENGGILSSDYEGKIRMYRFHADFPLLHELEMLLKKAYYQLPLEEKKQYYFMKNVPCSTRRQNHDLMLATWNHLKRITQMTLLVTTHTKAHAGENSKGKGEVRVEQNGQVIIFHEQGSWQTNQNHISNYKNSFRWTWNQREGMLSLEHLRHGENHPVFLFHLIPAEGNLLKSLNPHLCGEDTYYGWLQINDLFLQMNIRTIGPNKNEEIEYIYT